MHSSLTYTLILGALLSCPFRTSATTSSGRNSYAIAKSLSQKGDVARSLLILNRVADSISAMPKTHSDSILFIDVYSLNAQNYRRLGDTEKALSLYMKAMSMVNSTSDKRHYADLCNNIFAIYYSAHQYSNALDLLKKALSTNIALGDSANIRNNYNNFGLVAYEQRRYDVALHYMDKALSYTPQNDKIGQSIVFTNRAEVFRSQGQYTKAEAELNKSLRLQSPLPFAESMLQTSLNMAYVKAKLGKRSEAQGYVNFVKGKLPTVSLSVRSNAYRQMTDISFILGDSIEALHNILKYEELGDSVWNDGRDAQLRQLLVVYDTERLRNSNNTLEASVDAYKTIAKQRTFIVYVVITFIVILAVLIIILWIRMKSDRRKNRLINSQRDRLRAYEQKEYERKQLEMTHQLDSKTRQLTTYTIDLAAVNEFHQKLCTELSSLRDEYKDISAPLTTRLGEMIQTIRHYNDKPVAEDFRIYFDEVHPDFLNRLSHLYPQLSKMDLRLCAYLHLGMSTKEISALTYREVRSVESSRHRLRKKLGVPQDTSLYEFLSALQS